MMLLTTLKLRNFVPAKSPLRKGKQARAEKVFAVPLTDKRHVSEYSKHFCKSLWQRQCNRKMGKRHEKYFTKEIQIFKKRGEKSA